MAAAASIIRGHMEIDRLFHPGVHLPAVPHARLEFPFQHGLDGGALKAAVGTEVAEIEGPETERLVEELRALGTVRMVARTERGYRIGLTGPREQLTRLAAAQPGIRRFAIRPPTLEDEYFERTEAVSPRLMSTVTGERA